MSFERFASSDIYIYEHVGGFIECCGCSMALPDDLDMFGFAHLKTPREALAHLDLHEERGDDIGGARRRIEKEYEDLDAPIEPYVRSEEDEARIRAIMKDRWNAREEDSHG
jgi:hypothetical protein